MKRLLSFSLLLSLVVPSAVFAQTKSPLADRENKIPPIVSYLMSQGIKLTSLGDTGGIHGYLGEDSTGKMQTFYVTPDGNHVVAGILFGMAGKNITGIQIGEMRARFDAAARDLERATVDNNAPKETPTFSPSNDPGTPEDNAMAPVEKPAITPMELPVTTVAPEKAELDAAPSIEAPVEHAGTTLPVSTGITIPEATGPIEGASGNPSELWVSKMDKDGFLSEANALPYFEVGSLTAPATLWMVADPQCPYCHKAWDHIRPSIYAKKLKVRIILIAGLPGSRPLAQDLLARPLPARAWLDSDAGRNLTPATDPKSPEFAKAEGFLNQNIDFAVKFGFDRTPFLAYTADDGKFYSTLGLPSDLTSFLAASGI